MFAEHLPAGMVLGSHDKPMSASATADRKAWSANDFEWNGFAFRASPNRPKMKTRGRRAKRGEVPSCQVDGCNADLTVMKEYHQRYRICEYHLRVNSVLRDGQQQRFCQQCGRFHMLEMFDSEKRSCRDKLERHNARRRKAAQGGGQEEAQPANVLDEMTLPKMSEPLDRELEDPASGEQDSKTSWLDASDHMKRTHDSDGDGGSAVSHASLKRIRSPSCAEHLMRSAASYDDDMLPHAASAVQQLTHMAVHAPRFCDHAASAADDRAFCMRGQVSPGVASSLPEALQQPRAPKATNWSPFQQASRHLHNGPSVDPSHLPMAQLSLPPYTSTRFLPLSHLPIEAQLTLDSHPSDTHTSSSLGASYVPTLSSPTPSSSLRLGFQQLEQHPMQDDLPPLHDLDHALFPQPMHGHKAQPVYAEYAASSLPPLDGDLELLPLAFSEPSPAAHTYHMHDALHPPPATSLAAPVPDSHLQPMMLSMQPQAYYAPPALTTIPQQMSSMDYAHSLLSPAPLPTLYQSYEQLMTLSLKCFNCMPSELPPGLREELLDVVTEGLLPEGYIRPGCVQLTMDVFRPRGAPALPAGTIAQQLLLASEFWQQRRILVQKGSSVACLEGGVLCQAEQLQELPLAPVLSELLCICVAAGSASDCFTLRCTGAPAASFQLVCRTAGQYLPLSDLQVKDASSLLPGSSPAAAGQQHQAVASFQLPATCPPALLRVEAVCGHVISAPQMILVVGSEAIAQEVRQLEAVNKRAAAAEVLPDLARVLELEQNLQALYNASCCDLGQLLECGAEERPLMREYSSSEVTSCVMTARRLLAFCCESGWVHTFGAIVPVAAIGCRSAAELLSTVAAVGMRSLPLLHLAVMSKKPAMLAFLLDWGSCNGVMWRNEAGGPFDLTPLHLAALLKDCPVMAELLAEALVEGHAQWQEACTTDGLTPFDYAIRSGHSLALSLGQPPSKRSSLQGSTSHSSLAGSIDDATAASCQGDSSAADATLVGGPISAPAPQQCGAGGDGVASFTAGGEGGPTATCGEGDQALGAAGLQGVQAQLRGADGEDVPGQPLHKAALPLSAEGAGSSGAGSPDAYGSSSRKVHGEDGVSAPPAAAAGGGGAAAAAGVGSSSRHAHFKLPTGDITSFPMAASPSDAAAACDYPAEYDLDSDGLKRPGGAGGALKPSEAKWMAGADMEVEGDSAGYRLCGLNAEKVHPSEQDSTYSKLARVVKQVPSLPGKLLTCRHIVCMLVGLNVFMSLFALLLGQGQTSVAA